MFVTYNLNKYWTWKQPEKNNKRLVLFTILYAFALLINVGTNNIMLDYLPNYTFNFSLNTEMNEVLNSLVQSKVPKDKVTLDLFGGAGNLSKHIKDRVIVDYYEDIDQDNKIHLDLFDESSISKINLNKEIDCFIVDPPRKGFPLLHKWCDQYKPEYIVYISCHSSTMFRDLSKIKGTYEVQELHLLDLFPSTFHFEGLTVLKRI